MGGQHKRVPCPVCRKRTVRKSSPRCWDCYNREEGRLTHPTFSYTVTESGCWEWNGNKDAYGYGVLYRKGFPSLAHRAFWVLRRGGIPEGMDLLHSCDNPPCINPDHLTPGTQADNNRDRSRKGRSARGERSPHAKLKEFQALEILKSSKPSKDLALEFGVHVVHVNRIKRGEKWAHLQAEVAP